ncbi:MAG: InlB B-repeat-containing protein, partial [Oscillospiraceae bacterium]
NRVPTGTIAPDGSLVLSLYYDRDTFTIQLDTNGGSPIDDCIIARYGSPLGALPVPARANFEFAGWYTQQNGGTKVTAETPAADIGTTSLYAQWLAEDCGIIDGTVVVDGDGNPVEGAKITIRAGNKDYKSCTTDALGTFAIFGVKYGVYNLVAEKSGTVVTTKIVLDHKTLTRTIVLPMGKTNSVVVVEDGAPEVVVGGLDSLFEDNTIYTAGDTTVVHGGGTVAIRLTVSPLDPEEGAQAAAVVLNVTVQKEVTATGALSPVITPLTELPDLMEIFIPLEKEAQGHAIYSVQRSHNGKLDTISASPNTDGEYLKVEQDILVVYAKKFSTFAISYSDPEDSGYRIRAIAGDGGAIAPGSTYVTRNRNKTFTITPGSGY